MTQAADLVLTNAEIHTLTDPDRTAEALAVRDGEIVRVGRAYEIDFLCGVETTVLDLDGEVVLPGFVDAHTHLETLGRYLVHADLSGARSAAECVERLSTGAGDGTTDDEEAGEVRSTDDEEAGEVRSTDGEKAGEDGDDWVLGFGYDESAWEDDWRYLTREDLDRVSETRPVVAFREDMHIASLNSVALSRYREAMPDGDVHEEGGEPTGAVVEDAVQVIHEAIRPGPARMQELIRAAQAHANERGVTAIHDMVRHSQAPRIYRELDLAGELTIRVRLNYWSHHLDAVLELGLRTNHGSEFVRTGAIKTFTDGSIGSGTARVGAPFHDSGGTGQWVVAPDELASLVRRVDDAGLQLSAHAIGDVAIDETITVFEAETADPAAARHRIEHVEVLTDELIERLADSGLVVSMQPNFLKWAREDGLYDARLGEQRRRESNRFGQLHEAGARLAFGSDGMPLDPLFGVHQVVTAPTEEQRLPVTDALRAYTAGAAYAGFDEDRLGTIEVGKRADFVVLEASPWVQSDAIDEIDVATTIVDGNVVYDGR